MSTCCAALGFVAALGLARAAAPVPLPVPATSSGTDTSPLSLAQRVARLTADEAHRGVTASYVARAKIALERAAKERGSGNAGNAAMAERGADTWLDAAETLVQAVDGEELAATLELGALDAGARADRERALLEEALANAGRRRAELARIERDRGSTLPRQRTADIDGGVGTSATGTARSAGARSPSVDGAGDGGGLELRMPTSGARRAGSGASGSTPHEDSPP